MKIIATSDTHGNLPSIPDCDLLLLAGDILPNFSKNKTIDCQLQARWMEKFFEPYAQNLTQRGITVILTAGNHCFLFDERPDLIPKTSSYIYLENTSYDFNGLKVHGAPQTNFYHNWAFNKTEKDLRIYWDLIPDDTDILLTHGPVYGYNDTSPYGKDHVGSYTLREKIDELGNLKGIFHGHIHSGHGISYHGKILIANVSYVDESYKPCYALEEFNYTDNILIGAKRHGIKP